jgi:hypothetical protein
MEMARFTLYILFFFIAVLFYPPHSSADMYRWTDPSGTFVCYRMEVIVEITVLRPGIVYRVAKDAPYFLVNNVGKRGPLVDTYVKTLISRE